MSWKVVMEYLYNGAISLKEHILPVIGTILVFFAPIVPILILVGAAIVIDTIYGMWAAKKLGYKLTSRRFSDVVRKMIQYQIAILTLYCFDYFLLGEFFLKLIDIPLVVTKFGALMLILIEGFSVDESLKRVSPGKGILWHFKRMMGLLKNIKKGVDELKD